MGSRTKWHAAPYWNIGFPLRVPSNDHAQLLYRPLGQAVHSEGYSLSSGVEAPAEGYKRWDFWIGNLDGFEDGFRYDSVMQLQFTGIGEMKVRGRIAGTGVVATH